MHTPGRRMTAMRASRARTSSANLAVGALGLAAAYVLTGELSLVAVPRGYPPAVWAPAGVALVAVLMGGMRLLPGVALGAFAVNLVAFLNAGTGWSVSGAVLAAAGLGAGAGLPALVGVLLVRRLVVAPTALDEARDVGLFLVLAGPVASAIGATVATVTLLVARAAPMTDLGVRWSTLWLGETTGTLLVAPLLVTWMSRPRQMPGRRLWLTAPVVLAGALVMVLFARASRWEQGRLEGAFRRRADAVSAALERGSDHYLHVVQSIADFHNAVGHVDRGAFQQFVKGALARDPGIRVLGWMPRVTDVERADYEAGTRREGQEGFEFKEWGRAGELRRAGDRPEYYPLLFLEPESENELMLG